MEDPKIPDTSGAMHSKQFDLEESELHAALSPGTALHESDMQKLTKEIWKSNEEERGRAIFASDMKDIELAVACKLASQPVTIPAGGLIGATTGRFTSAQATITIDTESILKHREKLLLAPLDLEMWPNAKGGRSDVKDKTLPYPPLDNTLMLGNDGDVHFTSEEIRAEYSKKFATTTPDKSRLRLESAVPFASRVLCSGVTRCEETGELIRRAIVMIDLPLEVKKSKSAEELFREMQAEENNG